MRCAQIRHGLDAEQLRRGRKRKSKSGLRDWTEAEDVQLLKVVWSGARGEDRCTPTRSASACRQRLQLIRKHVDRQWLSLHMGDATLTANVTAVLEDESFQAEVEILHAPLLGCQVAEFSPRLDARRTPRRSPGQDLGEIKSS